MSWNGDPSAIHWSHPDEINTQLAAKATPVDADVVVIEDSEDSWAKKKVALSAIGTGGGGGGSANASYSEAVGDTSETTFNIEHSLDSSAVAVEVIEVSTGDGLVAGTDYTWSVVDDDTIQVVFASAPGSNDALVVVLASGGTSGGGSGNISGAYDIEAGTYTDAGLSDEFDVGSLDAQWTAVNMSSGTVNPITANPTTSVYDLSTRSGTLLVQLKPQARSYLRADSFIASGEQIIVSMGIATPGHTAVGNNALWAGIGYNDDDTDPYAGDDAQLIWDGTNDSRMLFMRNGAGTTLGVNNFAAPPSRRSYFRLMRSSDTVYAFHSMDGIVWSSLNSENTFVDTANNFWLIFDSNGTNWTHAPIIVVNWVRHVANLNFDPWTS